MSEPCEPPIMFELTQAAELAHWHGAADGSEPPRVCRRPNSLRDWVHEQEAYSEVFA
jgi:hypothetical protein